MEGTTKRVHNPYMKCTNFSLQSSWPSYELIPSNERKLDHKQRQTRIPPMVKHIDKNSQKYIIV